jgi:hypothetical protein
MVVPTAGVPGAEGSSAAAGAASAFGAAAAGTGGAAGGGGAAAAGAAAARVHDPIVQARARMVERITSEITRALEFIKTFRLFAQQFAYFNQIRKFIAGFEPSA